MRIYIKYSKRLPGKWQHVNDMICEMGDRARKWTCVFFCLHKSAPNSHTIRLFRSFTTCESQATFEFAFSRQMTPICVNVIILTAEENIWKRQRMATADDEFPFQ